MSSHAVVLLSGGLDSTAALAWALARYDVYALSIDYGQPNRDHELCAAQTAAVDLGAPWRRVSVCGALHTDRPVGLLSTEGASEAGMDRAFVPGRNLVFATIAAAHGATRWPGAFDVILGCNADDQGGFPDCRAVTLAQLGACISAGIGRGVRVFSPWASMGKSEIIYAIQPDEKALSAVLRSWSCYASHGPCGECRPCVLRADAMRIRGATDQSAPARMHGGDPHRTDR